MYLNEATMAKWGPVLDINGLPEIKDPYRKAVTAILLENQEKALAETGRLNLSEAAPTNSTAGVSTYDPILIGLVRRALPNLMAYDVAGVQPMTGPSGLIFALRSRYVIQSGTEAFFNEPDSGFSSSNAQGNTSNVGSQVGNNPVANTANNAAYTFGKGMTTAQGEALGDSLANTFAEMALSIEKITVQARSRKLKAEYSVELAQDMKAIHGLDVETELSNILSTEILAEINREVIRTIYYSAVVGAQYGVTTAGTFDLDTDSNGRWSVEKFKGLVFQLEREANAIYKATRRGKGNILIVSADVASALALAGVLDYAPAYQANLTVDEAQSTFAGLLHGRIKVYLDPYFGGSSNGDEFATVGYKGTSPYDAGIFYCPYVPLQMVRAVGQDSFQNKLGFLTRYGMVANPFAEGLNQGMGVINPRANQYYRILRIRNLM